jgi:hypothetical protein
MKGAKEEFHPHDTLQVQLSTLLKLNEKREKSLFSYQDLMKLKTGG